MIYITGDMHGDKDRFKAVKKAKIKKNDTLFICGDFGFIWNNSKNQNKILKWIGKRKYNVLFVDGSNENHKLISEYDTVSYCGGKAKRISGRLYCLLRGEVYDIEGKKVFCLGGGASDEPYAKNINDPILLPSDEELINAKNNLEKCNNEVDIIVTYDAPTKLRAALNPENSQMYNINSFLEEVNKQVKFKMWYMGKYHQNKVVPPHYTILFDNVVKYKE